MRVFLYVCMCVKEPYTPHHELSPRRTEMFGIREGVLWPIGDIHPATIPGGFHLLLARRDGPASTHHVDISAW